MQVIHLAGLPFETADTDELNYRKAVRDTMLRGDRHLGSASRSTTTSIRREVAPEVDGEFADDFSRDARRRLAQARLGAKKLYVNDLFLTLMRRPLQGRRRWSGPAPCQSGSRGAADKRRGRDRCRPGPRPKAALERGARTPCCRRSRPTARALLTASTTGRSDCLCSEPLEFLSAIYNGEMRPVLRA